MTVEQVTEWIQATTELATLSPAAMQALVSKLETKVYAPDTPRIYAQRLANKLEQLQEQIDYERDRELALRPYLVTKAKGHHWQQPLRRQTAPTNSISYQGCLSPHCGRTGSRKR
jgi:hypothetical protein